MPIKPPKACENCGETLGVTRALEYCIPHQPEDCIRALKNRIASLEIALGKLTYIVGENTGWKDFP